MTAAVVVDDRRARTPWARLERLGWRHGSKAIDAGMAGYNATYERLMVLSSGFYAAARTIASQR